MFCGFFLQAGLDWCFLDLIANDIGVQGVWFVLLWAVALGNWRWFAPDSVLSLTYSKVDARGLGFS
jgi:hypothetical protein